MAFNPFWKLWWHLTWLGKISWLYCMVNIQLCDLCMPVNGGQILLFTVGIISGLSQVSNSVRACKIYTLAPFVYAWGSFSTCTIPPRNLRGHRDKIGQWPCLWQVQEVLKHDKDVMLTLDNQVRHHATIRYCVSALPCIISSFYFILFSSSLIIKYTHNM